MDWPLNSSSTPEEIDFWVRELARERALMPAFLTPAQDELQARRLREAWALGADLTALDFEGARGKPRRALTHLFAGDPLSLRAALEAGADPRATDPAGGSPLHALAAKRGWQEQADQAAQALLAAGGDLEARDHQGRSVLAVAIQEGGSPFEWLALGADPCQPVESGAGPMWPKLAAEIFPDRILASMRHGEAESCEKDVLGEGWERRFELATSFSDQDWALHGAPVLAAAVDFLDWAMELEPSDGGELVAAVAQKARWMVSQGAPVDAPGQDGWTALGEACAHGRQKIFDVLASLGADMEAVAPGGFTPLMAAAWNGHGAIVSTLLRAGVKIDARDELGRSALDLAIEFGGAGCSIAVEILELEKTVAEFAPVASSPKTSRARL